MTVIGVDIGGTSIKGAAINDSGKILDYFSLPMDRSLAPEESFKKMCDVISEFLKLHQFNDKVVGIGLGVPGILDRENGIIKSSPNMPKWINFPIVEFVQKRLDLPVKIVNDASAAALGEARFGAGKKYNNMIMITLGTGVGGGIIINKKLYDGLGSTGAQLGHALLKMNGRLCSCGRKGCLEAYASATALIKDTLKAKKRHPESVLNKFDKIDAKSAFDAERMGDKVGHQLVNNYVMYLSEGLLSYCNIFRPDIFVLSGGVANEGDYLISRIKQYMDKYHYGYTNAPIIPIELASLGYDSGKIGAASLFMYDD